MKKHIVSLACLALVSGLAQAQSVTNGSMTGPVSIGSPPPSWNSVNADGDTIGPGGSGGWATGIAASNDGGTFLMVLDNGNGGFFDRCGQTITGFTVGQAYTIGFEYANGGLPNFGSYTNTLTAEMEIFGAQYLTAATAFDGIGQQQWRTISFNFVATDTSTTLYFRANSLGNGGAAAAIDGVYLRAVPAPGSLALAALAGVIGTRRRRN
jgi:hypothetical protein